MSTSDLTYRVLFQYFPVVDVTAKRALHKEIALDLGYRIMRLRELFQAVDRRRQDLLEDHSMKDDEGKVIYEVSTAQDGTRLQQIKVRDQIAFNRAWRDMLDQPISDYPEWPKKIDPSKLPDDITAFEIEALLRLRLINKPDVF